MLLRVASRRISRVSNRRVISRISPSKFTPRAFFSHYPDVVESSDRSRGTDARDHFIAEPLLITIVRRAYRSGADSTSTNPRILRDIWRDALHLDAKLSRSFFCAHVETRRDTFSRSARRDRRRRTDSHLRHRRHHLVCRWRCQNHRSAQEKRDPRPPVWQQDYSRTTTRTPRKWDPVEADDPERER